MNDILPVKTTPSEAPLPEADGGEDLLDHPQLTVRIVQNVLHVEELPARLQHSLDLTETLGLVLDRAENQSYDHRIHRVRVDPSCSQVLAVANLQILYI